MVGSIWTSPTVGAFGTLSAMRISVIERAGYGPQVLAKARAGESATKVHAWLKTKGVTVGLNSVKSFVRVRNGGKWSPRKPADVEGGADVMAMVAPVVEVVNRTGTAPTGELAEVFDLAMARVRAGDCTVADARVLEVALRAAIGRTLVDP